jgi:hypothetical protein
MAENVIADTMGDDALSNVRMTGAVVRKARKRARAVGAFG